MGGGQIIESPPAVRPRRHPEQTRSQTWQDRESMIDLFCFLYILMTLMTLCVVIYQNLLMTRQYLV